MFANIEAVKAIAASPQPTGTSENDINGSIADKKAVTKRYGKSIENNGTTSKFTTNESKLKVDEKAARKGRMAS